VNNSKPKTLLASKCGKSVYRLFSFIIFVFFTFSSVAYAGPFTCSGDVYQVQSGQLKIFNPTTSTYVNIGPLQTAYNAAGFNTLDNYAYGIQGVNLIRIHSDGTINVIANIGFGSNAGDMDLSNRLWVKSTNTGTQLKSIDVITGAIINTVTLSTAFNTSDLVVYASSNVAILANGTNIARVDLSTGATTILAVSGLPTDSFGAMWRDSTGRLFVFGNASGKIYEIFNYLGSSPSAVLAATGIASSNNDGFSCPNAPFPNLSPIAQNDNFITPLSTAITGNVLSNNGNGVDSDPENGVLTVATIPVSGPSNGTVTILANGSFTYTPTAGYSGTDSFVYRITDPSGLTATATVAINITNALLNITKVSSVYIPTAFSKFFLPQNDVIYAIESQNTGNQSTATNSIFILDTLPGMITFYNGDIDQGGPNTFAGTDPVAWVDNGSGLTFTYSTDVAFSNQALAPTAFAQCTYTPSIGYDANIRHLCINPKGALLAGGKFTLYFRTKIK
jgi:Bacterial Ig domain